MTRRPAWYRSGPTLDAEPPADLARPSLRRRIRGWLRDRLPDPVVRDRTMVLYCREGLRSNTRWPGMFSEFFSVLGALDYGERHGAAGLRVDFRSPHYLDPDRGPNWWLYFFERDFLPMGRLCAESAWASLAEAGAMNPRAEAGRLRARDAQSAPSHAEVHLNRLLAKYGRYGGFGDRIHGATPHMYPMTTGVPRAEAHRLLATHIVVRPEILQRVDQHAAAWLERGAFIVGVHYRGTDTARHYPFYRMPYEAYADEVRRALESSAPSRFQLFVATDESDFVAFMQHEFPGRVIASPDAPRVAPDALPIHFNRALGVSGYVKGESALVDCLLLARADYLVKGRSSLSDASLLVNARLPFSFCVG